MYASQVKIQIGNSFSDVVGASAELIKLLRYELSYPVSEPGQRAYPQDDGSVKLVYWDGYRRLMNRRGHFPSGLVPRAVRLLRKWGVAVSVADQRQVPPEPMPRWSLPPDFQLRPYQREACARGFGMTRGIFDSPPRSGKTCMMGEMCRLVADTTVITAPTVAIAKQTHEKLLELLIRHGHGWSEGRGEEEIQLLTGGPPKSQRARRQLLRAVVTVCTAKTAAEMSQTWWDRVRCLMVDERHHQAALATYGKINYLSRNAYYRWGYTGTNYRSDPREQVALEAFLGRVVASYSVQDMRDQGVIVPGSVRLLRVQTPPFSRAKDWEALYRRGVVQCGARNDVAASAARQLQEQGHKVLVLVSRIEHGRILESLIPGSRFVQGADGDDVSAAVRQLDAGELTCVIGSPVVGEGLDIPSADALVYVKGGQARVTHTQDVFRVLTGDGIKQRGVVIDFVDAHNPKLLEHAIARMKNYVSLGLQVTVDTAAPICADSRQLGLGPKGGLGIH